MIPAVLLVSLAAGQPPNGLPLPPRADAPRVPPTVRAAQDAVELLEARLATKQAYVKAAEVAVDGPKVELARLGRLAMSGIVSPDEFDAVKVKVREAEALVAVRKAEANEVAVELKHAARALDQAKARGAAQAWRAVEDELMGARVGLRAAQAEYARAAAQFAADSPQVVQAGETVRVAEARVKTAEDAVERLKESAAPPPAKK